jgi:hypothetical protein
MTWNRICLIFAVVLFTLDAIIVLGGGTINYEAALIPAGLAFFAAAFLV